MLRNRIICLGLFILSLIGISFYGGPVSYGFFFFMLTVPLMSFVYALITYFRFKIYQKIDAVTVVAGSVASYYFTLQNEDLYTISGIRTLFFDDFSTISDLDRATEYELMPHTGIRFESRLICKYRGEYKVGVKSVIVQDYLRLFTLSFRNREALKVRVMPRLTLVDSLRHLNEVSLTARDLLDRDLAPDITVRDYVPGDDIRYISWKTTARTGMPAVRNRIGENTTHIAIILDSCRYYEDPSSYLPPENKLIEIVLALAYYYLEHGIRVIVYAYQTVHVRYVLENPGEFRDFYQVMCGFVFDKNNTEDKLYTAVMSSREIYEAAAVINVCHQARDPLKMAMASLENNMISGITYLVTDETGEGESGGFIRIGCEDRLEEVL